MVSFKYFFKSMVSNKTCIENWGRKVWYVVVMMVIALSLVWIPPFWRNQTTKGSGTIGSFADFDSFLYTLVQKTDDNGTELGFADCYIDENGNFVASDKFKENATFSETNRDGLRLTKTTTQSVEGAIKDYTINLSVYYVDLDPRADAEQMNKFNTLAAQDIYKDKDGNDITKFSALFFTKTTFGVNLFNIYDLTKDSKPTTSFSGTYEEMPKGKENTFGNMIIPTEQEIKDSGKSELALVQDNWNTVMDTLYKPIQQNEMVTYLIMFEVGVIVLGLISSLIIFIATRGKRSLFKDMTYWGAIKVGFTMNFLPILIGWAFAFISGNQMGVIVMVSASLIRTIFSLSKISNRSGNDEAPLYQART